jgi:hypothetical protein
MRVAVRRYYARNLPSVCYLRACKFPPSSQCTEEYFRIIRMTTRREGEKRYRSDLHRIFMYNQHGPGDYQERRRRKAIAVTSTGFLSIISMARVTTRRQGGEKL